MAISLADHRALEQAAQALARAQEACGWLSQCAFLGDFGIAEARIAHRSNRQLRRRIAWAMERGGAAVEAG